ncbi:MAG: hypothetical protein R2932_42470 [Caldilineaceae bacterium]
MDTAAGNGPISFIRVTSSGGAHDFTANAGAGSLTVPELGLFDAYPHDIATLSGSMIYLNGQINTQEAAGVDGMLVITGAVILQQTVVINTDGNSGDNAATGGAVIFHGTVDSGATPRSLTVATADAGYPRRHGRRFSTAQCIDTNR